MSFRFAEHAIDTVAARAELLDPGAGGFVTFEGWVRDFNEGREVTALEYEAFQSLAVKEGARILAEATARFPVRHALCIHRVGRLALTDMAVWVGVSATH
jgi:molybdopterin synthase catalytic subunit